MLAILELYGTAACGALLAAILIAAATNFGMAWIMRPPNGRDPNDDDGSESPKVIMDRYLASNPVKSGPGDAQSARLSALVISGRMKLADVRKAYPDFEVIALSHDEFMCELEDFDMYAWNASLGGTDNAN